MKIRFILTLLLITAGVSMQAQNNGVGTKEPTHTLHVKPDVSNPNQDPLRLENLQVRKAAGDSTILVVDPAAGIVRYMPIDSLIRVIGGSDEISNLASSDMAQKAEERTYNIGAQKLTFENTGVNDNLLVIDGQNNRIGLGTTPQTGLDLSGVGQDGDGSMNSWDDYRIILDGAATPDKAYGFGTTASGLRLFSGGNQSFVNSGTEMMRIKGDGGISFNQYGQGDFDEANPEKILGLKPDGSVVEISPENLKASPQTLSLNGEKLAISDGNDVDLGNLKSKSPWFDKDTKKPAEANTDDVYLLGKVGIGTNNPDRDLIVNGSQKVTAQMAIGGNDQDGNYGMTARNSGAGAFFGYVGKNPNIPTEGAAIVAGNNKNIYMFTEKDGAAGSSQNPSLDVNIPRLTIEAESGQVGLGTTAPTKKLDVNGQARIRNLPDGAGEDFVVTAAANGNLRKVNKEDLIGDLGGTFYSEDGTLTQNRAVTTGNFKLNFDANSLVVDGATNNIGIGTDAPKSLLQIKNNVGNGASFDKFTDYQLLLYQANTAQNSYGLGIEGYTLAMNTNRDIDFKIKGADNMTLNPTGLGLGTNAPTQKLDVKGKLIIRGGGGNSDFTTKSTQIMLGYAGSPNYRHSIRTRHHGGQDAKNSIDFYVWDFGTDKKEDEGSKRVMTIDGAGAKGKVEVIGNLSVGELPAGAATDQIITTDANGNLRKLPASSITGPESGSIYTENGTLTQNRAVTTGNYKLNFDANTLVVDGATNNVGIGTAAPKSLLQIRNNVGDANSFDKFTDYQLLLYQGNTSKGSYGLGIEGGTFALNSGSQYDFKVQGTDRMTLTTTGLGVGVNAPKNLFQIKNNVGDANSFDKYTDYQILLYQGSNPKGSYGLGIEGYTMALNSARDFDFKVGGTDRMTLNNVGLGIGVNAPKNLLQIKNNVGDANSFDKFTDYQVLLYQGNNAKGSYGVGIEGGTFALNSGSQYDFKVQGTDRMTLTTTGLGVGVNAPKNLLQIKNNVGDANSFDKFTDYQILLYQGNNAKGSYGVGIEGGTFALNSGSQYDFKIGGTDRMNLTNKGLGVGVAPQNLFQIKNNVGDANSFDKFTDYQVLLYQGGNAKTSYGLGIEGYTMALNSARDYDFKVQGADKMTLTTAGLGIGTNSPSKLLDVNGEARIRNLPAGAATDQIITTDANGNLRKRPASDFGGGGSTSETLFTANGSLTGNRSVATGDFDLNVDANTFMIDGSANRVGIGTNAPASKFALGNNIAHDANFDYAAARVSIFDANHNGGNNPRATRDILHLVREGVGGQAYGNKASFSLGRYENSGVASRTQLDIKLTDNNFNTHRKVMSLRANGQVGIGTTAPTKRLDVNGQMRIRSLPNGAAADLVVTTDADGNLRKRALASVDKNLGANNMALTANRNITMGQFDLNMDANTLVVDGSANRVGVGTTAPASKFALGNNIAHDANFDYSAARVTIFDANHNGGNNPRATRDIFNLVREGVGGQAYGNKATFSLGRYENSGVASRTQLDIKLTDNSFNTHRRVMSLRANGQVGIGTAAPTKRLDVNGQMRIRSLPNGAAADLVVTTDADGNLRKRALASVDKNLAANNMALTANRNITMGQFDLNMDANTLVVDGSANRVGIGTTAPASKFALGNDIAHDANFDYSAARVSIFDANHNGGNNPRATRDIFHLVREGVGGQAYGNKATFSLGRYENSGVASRTQLDIKLTDNSFNTHRRVMSLRANGQVGIGTATPTKRLDVNGQMRIRSLPNGAAADLVVTTDADGNLRKRALASVDKNLAANNMALTANRNITMGQFDLNMDANTLVVDGSANRVGVGTTAPASKFALGNNIAHDANFDYSAARVTIFDANHNGGNNPRATRDIFNLVREGVGGQAYGNKATFSLGRYENNGVASRTQLDIKLTDNSFNTHTKVMSLRANGNVGVGTTAPTQLLSVNGTAGKVGGGAWATFSDRRIKKNVAAYTDGLEKLMKIQPKTFQYNGKGGYKDDGKTYYGIIAQEIQKVAPYMVNEVETEDFKDQLSYDGTALTYMLVNAVKEQQKELESQEEKLAAFQAQVEDLLKQNTALKAQADKVDALNDKLARIEAMLEKSTKATGSSSTFLSTEKVEQNNGDK